MAKFDLPKVRNIGIIAHIDAGKTTTTEHILYYSGAKHKLGGVDEGTTETDYDVEEQNRGITIYSACIPFSWRDCTVNLIDTPGHVDFTAEVERSLRVLDGAVVVFDAQKGVEAQSETVWRQADKYAVPRMVFVNKMDVVGANFSNVIEEVKERLEGQPAPVTIPIGAGSIKDGPTPFIGIIDLLEMKALYFDAQREGKTFRTEPIPEDQQDWAQQWRDYLFEVLTRHDDKDLITTAYLEGKDIPIDTLRQIIRTQTLARLIHPVLAGSGREHIGVQPLMDAVCHYLPSPLDRPAVVGRHPKSQGSGVRGQESGDREEKAGKPDPKEPLAALVFKIVADKHGDLYYLRIYSGTLKPNSRVWNPVRQAKEFASKVYHIHADPKHREEELPVALAGDIVAIIGPKDSITGDTLCDPQHPIVLEQIEFANAVVSMSIEPESSADKDKLELALGRLKKEDPTFTWTVNPDTGQSLISGMGILHLEVKKNKLERDFNLKVKVSKPLVSYRETVRKTVEKQVKFEKYIGSDYVPVVIDAVVEHFKGNKPIEIQYVGISRDDFPAELIHSFERTLTEQTGWLGYPLIDIRVSIKGLQLNADVPLQINEIAVQAAAAELMQTTLKDNLNLLEPVMDTEVSIPEEYLGPVNADLNARRAEITDVLARGKLRVIKALVPLAKMFDYSDKVRSLTQGRASWTMEPKSYAPVDEEFLRKLLHPDDEF